MNPRKLFATALIALSCVSAAPHMAAAQRAQPEPEYTKVVPFEGKSIDLAKDWEGATACMIWDQAGATECFRTKEELDAHEDAVKAANPNPLAACTSALYLYEHSNSSGRLLRFYDRGYWQNLGNYGFNDELSSFSVGNCGVHLAWHSNGGGNWYPGYTGPGGYAGTMGGWNDEVSSIFIK